MAGTGLAGASEYNSDSSGEKRLNGLARQIGVLAPGFAARTTARRLSELTLLEPF